VPIEETLRALDDLVRQGKVRYLGCSNYTAWQIVDADWTARTEPLTRFISAQNAYNLLDRQAERELLPACIERGVGVLPYFPLASGFLTGKFRRGQVKPADARLANERPTTEYLTGVPDAIVRQVNAEMLRWVTPDSIFTDQNYAWLEHLEAFARRCDRTVLELAIAWLAGRAGVASVLVGVSRPEQIDASANAADWKLTPEQAAEIDEVTIGAQSLPPVPRTL